MTESSTTILRRLLDERGVEHEDKPNFIKWDDAGQYQCFAFETFERQGLLRVHCNLTPEQAIAATVGRGTWVNPTWERWHRSLRHDEIKSIGDAVEQLMYEVIEFGGDMGPNGNTYNGIDEGDVLTSGFINEWIERFESTLGSCNCSNNCTNSERTETCHPVISDNLNESEGMGDAWADCSECGHLLFVLTDPNSEPPNYCPNCGKRVVEPTTNDVDAEVDS